MRERKDPLGAEGAVDDLEWEDDFPLPIEQIRAFFTTLEKTLKAEQLYDDRNPVYRRFIDQLEEAFGRLWQEVERLEFTVEANAFTVEGVPVYTCDDDTGSLCMHLYKDGLRKVSLLPGVEDEEMEPFVKILSRAWRGGDDADDAVALLWEAEFEFVQYAFVDLLVEGLELPEPGLGAAPDDLAEMIEEGGSVAQQQNEQGEPEPVPLISLGSVDPRKFILTRREREAFKDEVQAEMDRDVRRDVLAALLDRFEDPEFDEQRWEIIEIFRSFLPNFLASGDFRLAGLTVELLTQAEHDAERFPEDLRREISDVLLELGSRGTMAQILQALQAEAAEASEASEEIGLFVGNLPPQAIRSLLEIFTMEGAAEEWDAIQEGLATLGRRHPQELIALARSEDGAVVRGALAVIAKVGFDGAAPLLAELSDHPDPEIRVAAIEVGVGLRASIVAAALETRLWDPEKEVRVAAVRALAEMRYRPGLAWVREAVSDKDMHAADLAEQMAFFECFGKLAGPEEVPFLEKLLMGGRRLFGRQPSEIRACAALALGEVDADAAGIALARARDDSDPVVRRAAKQALARRDGR